MDNHKNIELGENRKQAETIILEGMSFKGDIKGSHNLFLNGDFEGTIELNALLFVGQSGHLNGKIQANKVIIEGEIEGTVTANEKIELRESGRCKGDIFAPSVMLSDKAFFQGQVKMSDEENKISTFKSKSKSKEKGSKVTVIEDAENKNEEAQEFAYPEKLFDGTKDF